MVQGRSLWFFKDRHICSRDSEVAHIYRATEVESYNPWTCPCLLWNLFRSPIKNRRKVNKPNSGVSLTIKISRRKTAMSFQTFSLSQLHFKKTNGLVVCYGWPANLNYVSSIVDSAPLCFWLHHPYFILNSITHSFNKYLLNIYYSLGYIIVLEIHQ